MDVEVIRRFVDARPFRPLVFNLDNGEKHHIRHPEIILTDDMIIAVDDDGLPVVLAPEAISSIHRARGMARPRTPRRRSKR